jgi:SAM-dependent methyltransferase
MNDPTRERLATLPSLGSLSLSGTSMPCKVCGVRAPFFDATDFHKCTGGHPFGASGIEVRWFRCNSCDFLFTPFFDDWAHQDFTQFVYNADYIFVDPDYKERRPIQVAEQVAARLKGCEDLRILDYGSGTGAMSGRLTEFGFRNIVNYDPFSQPVAPTGEFDLITCFEVIEHSPDPLATLADMRRLLYDAGGCIILGETLQPANIRTIRTGWWYCAPRNGHCSTFTADTLSILARNADLVFHPGTNIHCFRLGASPKWSAIADRIGTPLFSAVITAPEDAHADGWHNNERGFRWTRAQRLSWDIPLPRGLGTHTEVHLRVPFAMEVRRGLAAECRVGIGDQMADVVIENSTIQARATGVTTSDDALRVVLVTPPPCSPAELRGSPDTRHLGLAIRYAEAAPRVVRL